MAGGNPVQPVSTRAPRVRQTDMKTLARKFSEGQKQAPSYEFGNGRRRFIQPGDKER